METYCDGETISNNLAVHHVISRPSSSIRADDDGQGRKKRFAVCVKGLDFIQQRDSSSAATKLVEWIELLDLMGVDKIFMYNFAVHADMRAVLSHYERLGKVDVKSISLPGHQPNVAELRSLYLWLPENKYLMGLQETVFFNDCFYRVNLDAYDYVAFLDTDEVIVPKSDSDWDSMLRRIDDQQRRRREQYLNDEMKPLYYGFVNVYFWSDDTPRRADHQLAMLGRRLRVKDCFDPQVDVSFQIKSIVDVQRVFTAWTHFPLKCLPPAAADRKSLRLQECEPYTYVDAEIAERFHFRDDSNAALNRSCSHLDGGDFQLVEDGTLRRYEKQLMARVASALRLISDIRQ